MINSNDLIYMLTGIKLENKKPIWDDIENIWYCPNCSEFLNYNQGVCVDCKQGINWDFD